MGKYEKGPQIEHFDIRSVIKCKGHTNDYVEIQYDMVNRMVMLIGDIPFRDLFEQPFGTLMQGIADRMQAAEPFDLLPRRDSAIQAFARLATFGGRTCRSCLRGMRSFSEPEPQAIVQAFDELWSMGIVLPGLMACSEANLRRERAIETVMAIAPNLTYRALHTGGVKNVAPDAATRARLTTALVEAGLFLAQNGFCCCDRTDECIRGIPSDYCISCDPADDPTPCGPPP